MEAYITRINGVWMRDASRLRQQMTAETAHQLGFREMGIYRYHWPDESKESLSSRLDGIIAGISGGDLAILQLPTGNGLKFDAALADRIRTYGGRLGIFVHEAEPFAQKGKRSQLQETVNLYNRAEVLIVPTHAMRQKLSESGVRKNMKYVIQELWDYLANDPIVKPAFQKKIHFTGGTGSAELKDWAYPVPLKVTDPGKIDPRQLLQELSAGGFGLLWYQDADMRQYMELSSSFSLSRYLAAGIPVIAPVGSAHQTLIQENHLGLVVNSLEEAAAAVGKMTEEEYGEYAGAVGRFAPALRNGYYTKRCLIEAMQAFFRKDAGRISLPETFYRTGKCVFTSTDLHESYGGNLALSWSFQGRTDGFLICDASGENVLGETRNVHQHYFLLERGGAESGFT